MHVIQGDEEDAENDPLTKQKIEELLEYYGGGPPKIDNLPNMPETGTKVIKGPDWMWQKNDIPDKIEGTVISHDQEDLGKNVNQVFSLHHFFITC